MESKDFAQLLEHVPAVVFRLRRTETDRIADYVTKNISIYGYHSDDFLAGRLTWASLVHPDDRLLALQTIRDYQANGINHFRLYYRLMTGTGDSIPITEHNTVNRDNQGNISSYDTAIVNSSSITVAGQNLLDNHLRQQVVLNDILLTLHDSDLDHALQIILDRTGEYLNTSRALLVEGARTQKTCKLICQWNNTGIAPITSLNSSITYDAYLSEICAALQKTGSLLMHHHQAPAHCREAFVAAGLVSAAVFTVYLNGEPLGFISFEDCVVARYWDEDTVRFLKNISNLVSTVLARRTAASQLAQSQETVRSLAFTDHLTKLSNRFCCDEVLQQSIDLALARHKTGYLLFVDMDDFKIVNDSYGHDYGDAVLASFANWLLEEFPLPHRVFRFGGDEFLVLLDFNMVQDVDAVLRLLHERAASPWKAMDKEFYCTLSIGVAQYPGHSADSKTIIKQADMALYEAKRWGKNNHHVYEERLESSTLLRTHTENLLRASMKNGFEGFELFYQPIVSRATGTIEGAEALLRIWDGTRMVMPADFLPLAEYLGFTIPIGEYVMEAAMQQCRLINESGFPDFKVHINISQKQLQQKNALERFELILARVGVNPRNLVLSFSEKSALEDLDHVMLMCTRLQDLGVGAVLDDFGGGSASFLQLHLLPVNTITTSLALMENLDGNYSKEFIRLMIDLCHSMKKEICINGIETEMQHRFCQNSKADKLQGFYLSRVIDSAALTELLRRG